MPGRPWELPFCKKFSPSATPRFTGGAETLILQRTAPATLWTGCGFFFREIRNQGYEEEARAGVNYLAEAVGCRLAETNRPEPDKDSKWDECLDDYPALTDFHNAVRQGKSWAEICHLAEQAKREIDETVSASGVNDA